MFNVLILKITVWVEWFSVRSSFREHDGADDGGGAGVEEHVGLLVAGVGWEEVLDKLVLDKPGLGPDVEPDEDVGQGLEEEERDEREHGDEGEEVAGGLPLGQLVVGRRVPYEEDGDGGEADVRHQVLVVARLRPDLETKKFLK